MLRVRIILLADAMWGELEHSSIKTVQDFVDLDQHGWVSLKLPWKMEGEIKRLIPKVKGIALAVCYLWLIARRIHKLVALVLCSAEERGGERVGHKRHGVPHVQSLDHEGQPAVDAVLPPEYLPPGHQL